MRRGVPLDTLTRTLRHAVRSLLRHKTLSLLAVVCMGLGIGTCVTLFTAINPWLYRPLPYPAAGRLVTVRETLPEGGGQWSGRTLLSAANYLDWQARARSFDNMGAFERTEYNLSTEGEPERVAAARITASLLPTLGMAPAAGRLFDASEDRPGSAVALISHSLWQRRLGQDPAVVGRTLRLDGRLYSIVGVMPERFNFPEYAEVWTPLGLEVGGKRDEHRFEVLACLRRDTPLAKAQSEAAVIAAQLAREHPDTHEGRSALVRPYIEAFTPPGVVIGMYLVLAAGLFVQLIASANVANLLLVKAAGQRHDTALRFALGARRSDVLRQSLVETLLLVGAGAAMGLALGHVGSVGLAVSSPVRPPSWVSYELDGNVVAFTIALVAASALVVSLVPALHGGRSGLVDELKESGRTTAGGARGRLGRLLTVAELAAALVLLIAASLMVQSFHRRYSADVGVATHGVLTARIVLAGDAYREPGQRAAFVDELLRRLSAGTEVAEAGVANALPFQDQQGGYGWSSAFEVEGQPLDARQQPPRAVHFVVSRGFPAAAGIRLRAGRWLSAEEDQQGREVVLVSASLARRYWGTTDPLGRRLRIEGGPWLRVVGVTEDVRDAGDMLLIGDKPGDQVYVPWRLASPAELVLAVRTRSDPEHFADALRASVRSLDPALPLHSVFTLDEARVRSAWVAQMWGQMLSEVAALALVLAVLGVYGVVSYSVSQRTHEIGIRMAVGADRGRVLRLVLGDGLRLALQAAALGLLGALVLTRSLSRLLYGVGALDPVTFAACSLALVLVALVASGAPAWRGTRVDPVVALRAE
jgi:putative ABC transport system permease protein